MSGPGIDMNLPPQIMSAIAAPEGGKVVLVIGAGCSVEQPTNLPAGRQLSINTCRQLVADGVLQDGECPDPSDLSALADLIKRKNYGKQEELVSRLPITEFKNAKPNEGHKIAAALLVERAVINIVTLNFDLTLSHALSEIGAGKNVCIVTGPEQHDQSGVANLIYLHRSVTADPEELVLTTDALDSAWEDAWEELIARRILASPVTVFVGLGSSCGVLRHSAKKIRTAIGPQAKLLLANPGDPTKSTFAREMNISEDDYIRLGWIDFMRELAKRFHVEVVCKIEEECKAMSLREGWIDTQTNEPDEDIDSLLEKIKEMDLLSFGETRARWLLRSPPYPKLEEAHISSIADLLLCIAYVERCGGVSAMIQDDGHVVFFSDNSPGTRVRLVDGSTKNYRWLTLEIELREQQENLRFGNKKRVSNRILACGVTGRKPDSATSPDSIICDDRDPEDIVDAGSNFKFWSVDELREDPGILRELLV